MLGSGPYSNLDLAQRGLRTLLERRQFGPGRAQGDHVEFSCKDFTLNIVFYRADLWAEVYQNDHPDAAIALVNLLSFLSLASTEAKAQPVPANGSNVSSWRLTRLSSLAVDIDTHYDALSAFFCTGDLATKRAEVTRFVVARNPDLFRRRSDP